MTENKFGWKAGDGLVWSSPEGCDKSCVVTKATAQMIEFETEEGEVKRVKGNNPNIARIDDSPPKAEAESITMPEAKAAVEAEPEMEPGPEPEPSAETSTNTKPEKAGECAPVDESALTSAGAEERISERKAEVDLKSGGVVEISVQLREDGALRAGDQEFRLASGDEWHPSLEEALDAEYGGRWMCIRWRDG